MLSSCNEILVRATSETALLQSVCRIVVDIGGYELGWVGFARDDAHKDEILAGELKNKKVEVSRFKGLGEMNPAQLRETTMDPKTRGMIRITLPQEYEEQAGVKDLVDRLMGTNPAHRFAFIQDNAAALDEDMIDA